MSVDVPDILKKIIARKHQEIADAKAHTPMEKLTELAADADDCRGFLTSVQHKLDAGSPAVIAEIKKASPSKGILREPFSPADIAVSYENAGAACLSVLTDVDFFMGGEWALREARAACALPVIRKDFIVDPYQVLEARAMQSDCILLIAAVLSENELRTLYNQAVEAGMDVLVDNRDLRTFDVSLKTTESLLPSIAPGTTVVTESGIMSQSDVVQMQNVGVNAFLVGEAFMRSADPGEALSQLFKAQI